MNERLHSMGETKEQKGIRLCGVYARVSTQMQARVQDGSLDTQESLLRQVIQQRNALGEQWELVKVYRETESAKDTNRPRFQEMLCDIREQKINMVIFTKLDRVSRSVRDFLHFADSLAEHQCGFFSLNEQFDSTGPTGRLLTVIIMALAEFERNVISERIREKMQWRASEGIWNGGQRLGYDRDGNDIRVNEGERIVVEAIFRTYLETGSIRQTVKRMNEMGFRTKQFVSKKGRAFGGGLFSKSPVATILSNPVYIGKVRHNGELFDGKHAALIDEDLFGEVQQRLKANDVKKARPRKRSKHLFLLEGLLTCGKCGGSLTPTWSRGKKGKDYRYYLCVTHREGNGCDAGRVNADAIEQVVAERIVYLSQNGELVKQVLEQENETHAAKKNVLEDKIRTIVGSLSSVEGQLASLVAFLAGGGESRTVQRELQALEVQQEELHREIARNREALGSLQEQLVSREVVEAGLNAFATCYESGSPRRRKLLCQIMIDEVIFYGDRIKMALYEVELDTGPLVAALTDTSEEVSTSWPGWWPNRTDFRMSLGKDVSSSAVKSWWQEFELEVRVGKGGSRWFSIRSARTDVVGA
jgi:site-specific DNA recombinase